MTLADLRHMHVFMTIMSRAHVIGELTRRKGAAVDITLRMSRRDLADLAWAMSRSEEEPPGAWTLAQIGADDA